MEGFQARQMYEPFHLADSLSVPIHPRAARFRIYDCACVPRLVVPGSLHIARVVLVKGDDLGICSVQGALGLHGFKGTRFGQVAGGKGNAGCCCASGESLSFVGKESGLVKTSRREKNASGSSNEIVSL
jgi:hypothetical protein